MSIKDGHTIEKLTFDIQIPSEKQFNYFSDLISSITEHELNAIIDVLLNKYNIQDQTIRIPEITLDLGNISETDTRNHIITEFKIGLGKWFEEKFLNNNYKTDKEIKTFSLSEREFNLIKHFITHGNIPWWGVNPPFLPDELFKKYIREERIKTKNLIFTLGKNKDTRKRIVYQFKDETLYQLFGILSPRPSSFFKQYATDLTEIHQKQKVVEEEDRAFKKVLQELILTYLISHTATSIDQTSFFKKQLLLLSKQYGISYKSILERINEAIKTLPESYPQTFGIKNIVKELLKRDFLTIALPKPSKNLDFNEYNELLTLFYTSNPNQLVGKYKSKRERDRLIRIMLRQNKQKTFQLLSALHRKFNISKVHTASLFSEGLLFEMMEIWHQPHLEMANSMIDSFKYLNNKFFIFSNSNLNVRSIIYSHILSHSFAVKKISSITATQIIKNITKTYSLNKEFLIRQFYLASLSYSPKIKNKLLIHFLKDEQILNIGLPNYTNLNLFQLKNILGKYLGTNYPLFEEFIKNIINIYPSLKIFVGQPAFHIILINKWMENPERNEHFPNFIDELITLLSQKIPLENSDFYQSLLLNKKAISIKLFKTIQQVSKGVRSITAGGIKQILSDPRNYDKLDFPQLKNLFNTLLIDNFPLFEEFIKNVTTIYPSLKIFVSEPSFYIILINKWMEKPERNEHFPYFIDELINLLSKKIPLESTDFQQALLLNKKAISAKLFKAIQQVSKDERNISAEGIKQILSDSKNYNKLDFPQLNNLFNTILRGNFPLFEEFIKNVINIYPSLKIFVSQPAFYIILINKWMEKPERNEHFPYFIDELINLLSQKIPLESTDFQQALLLNKKAISAKLFKVIQQVSKDERDISPGGIKQILSDPKNYAKLELPQLKNILAKLLKGNFPLFEEFIKKVFIIYPSLKTFIDQPAFYIFLINIILLNQSDIYKIDHFLLKVISKLANKSKVPLKTFIYPLLKTSSVIPDKLTKTLRLVYETILEKNPTYAETVETPFKAAESIEKLIDILGNSLFNEFIITENTDKTSLFLEVLMVQKELVLERLFEHKFNPAISFLLVNGLPEEALQFLQMSIAGESYNELINASNDLTNWFNRYNIIKLPRNKIGLWVKQNTLHFILLKEGKLFNTADYYQFILEKLQKERILQLKELDKTIENLPLTFQSEILDLISEQNNMPLPKAWRDNQFYNDILIHYLLTGKIQGWLDNPYLELKELYYIFNEALKAENISLIKGILAIPMTNNILTRMFSLLGRTDPLVIIHLINKIYPQKSILSFYQSVNKIAEGLNISSEIKKSIFIVFMQNKMWTIINPILRSEMITDGINKIYNTKIKLDEAEISGQSFKITWLQYYLESGFWPEGFPEDKISLYYAFLKSRILENPILILNITENISYHSFHQNILREIFSSKEIAFIFKEILKLKNINSINIENIVEIYLLKGTKYINEKKLEILFDSLLSLLLFERNQNLSIDNQLMSDLNDTISEITNIEKPKIKTQSSSSDWDKEIALLDYYLTYGSIPIEYPFFDAKKWILLIENLKINAPRNLMYKLHFWSKTPYKINRLLDLVPEDTAILLISLINNELYEQIIFLEKLIGNVSGENLRQKLGFKDGKTFIKNILFMWSKSQKIQPSPIPIVYLFFSMYIEKKRIQPNILLALIVEKVKNVSSKQINVIKSLQKYAKDTQIEKKIKKEAPILPEGLPPESIYIANAGLILLWPFLGRFFRRLNLVGAKEFIDESSRMRAILLIQYLVTGKKEAPEYELALNKLLCGAEMDMEIDMEIEITEEEINLSNSLLNGAITNWEKLKGTRIGTFRETFLQRNGSLYYINNRWELQVEKKAYDVLLETLPWGIQMIQMSWMKERLVVLWR